MCETFAGDPPFGGTVAFLEATRAAASGPPLTSWRNIAAPARPPDRSDAGPLGGELMQYHVA